MREYEILATHLITTTIKEIHNWHTYEQFQLATRWMRPEHPTWNFVCAVLGQDLREFATKVKNKIWSLWNEARPSKCQFENYHQAFLDAVPKYKQTQGQPPRIKHIADMMGCCQSVARQVCTDLERQGLVSRIKKGKGRGDLSLF